MRFAFLPARSRFDSLFLYVSLCSAFLIGGTLPLHADSLPILPINTGTVLAPTGYDQDVTPLPVGYWEIDNAAGKVAGGANNVASGGWRVNYTGTSKIKHGTLTVTTPTTPPTMPTNYTVSCGVYTANGPDGPGDDFGPGGQFTLVPTRPVPVRPMRGRAAAAASTSPTATC